MRLLDLFCGAGGAAMGYHRAGFDQIVGVDIEPQPDYPFDFIHGDVMHLADAGEFDLIHASPPCQAHSTLGNRWQNPRWPDLIEPTRRLMLESGIPYVLENVPGALGELVNPIRLTGEMFDLPVHRARLFELGGWWTLNPPPPPAQPDPVAVYGRPDGRRLWTRTDGTELRAWSTLTEGQTALGVPWITTELGIRESIPPAYTEWLGSQWIDQTEQVTSRL